MLKTFRLREGKKGGREEKKINNGRRKERIKKKINKKKKKEREGKKKKRARGSPSARRLFRNLVDALFNCTPLFRVFAVTERNASANSGRFY